MDDFVCDKLKEWGLAELVEIFRDEGIDSEILYDLEDGDIDKLIPKMGPRLKFKKKLNQLKEKQNTNQWIDGFPTQLGQGQQKMEVGTEMTACHISARPAEHLRTSTISVGLLNICSLTKKDFFVYKLLEDKQFDFLCLTETWQKENDFTHLNKAAPDGYLHTGQPRSEGRGGGVAMLHRDKWLVSPLPNVPTYNSFESVVLKIHLSVPIILATIYRPPKPNRDFSKDFSSLLTFLRTLSPSIVLVGDFNIHMDKFGNTLTRDFSTLLDSFEMQQHVEFPTHRKGHILDLVCCSAVDLSNCTASDLPNCDHKLISFNITFPLTKL